MSRIFDAIQCARESRAKNGTAKAESLAQMELPDRRATPRKGLDLNLTVYGRSSSDAVFYEQAKAISGNANGGVFLFSIPVIEGQDLLLINCATSEEQICRVVNVRIVDIQSSEVSVSFPEPNGTFWLPFKRPQRLR
jgi:hypothetical protein